MRVRGCADHVGDVEEDRDGGDVKPQQAQALVLEELESKSIRESSQRFMGAAAAAVANNGIIIIIIFTPFDVLQKMCNLTIGL